LTWLVYGIDLVQNDFGTRSLNAEHDWFQYSFDVNKINILVSLSFIMIQGAIISHHDTYSRHALVLRFIASTYSIWPHKQSWWVCDVRLLKINSQLPNLHVGNQNVEDMYFMAVYIRWGEMSFTTVRGISLIKNQWNVRYLFICLWITWIWIGPLHFNWEKQHCS